MDESLSNHEAFVWRAFVPSIERLMAVFVEVDLLAVDYPKRMGHKSITLTDPFLNH